jgi:cation:H+ antiporter
MFWTILGLVALLIVGFAMLSKGSDWLVDGASSIAKKFKIPQLIIGLTIVAMGTSAPETAVSISSVIKGSSDISIGNVVGANLITVLIVLGISSIITTLAVQKSTIKIDIPLVLVVNVALLLFGLDGTFNWWNGLIFFTIFIGYMVWLVLSAMKERKKLLAEGSFIEEEEEIKEYSVLKSIFLTLLGLAVVIGGSYVAVESAKKLATIIGLTERIIALTVVSIGNSRPEMFTSVKAAMKGNAYMAIDNVIGSNFSNLLLF